MDFLPFLIEEIRKALDSSRSEVRLAILGFFFFLFICFIIYRALEVVRRRRLLDVLGELASQPLV